MRLHPIPTIMEPPATPYGVCVASKDASTAVRALDAQRDLGPPWRQPRGKSMVSFVNSHTNSTRIGWHLWEIDLIFAPGLPPGWCGALSGGEEGFPEAAADLSSRLFRNLLVHVVPENAHGKNLSLRHGKNQLTLPHSG